MSKQRDEFGMPERVVKRLRAAYEGSGRSALDGVSGAVDRAVMQAFGVRRATRWRWGWAGAAAAGLAVVIGGGVWWGVASAGRSAAAGAYVRTGDIRDAYFVARELAAGKGAAMKGWDQNGDGVVDDEDVRALAMAAVTLRADDAGGVR